jgi:hypothetical protein
MATTVLDSQFVAQLQAFLDAIPYANEGDVITPEHHNSLRAACGRLANALDQSQIARVVTQSFTPVLLPVIGKEQWRITQAFCVGDNDGGTAEGWMPLDLPNGASVDTVTVRGKRLSTVTIWSAALRRVELSGTGQREVCSAEIQGAPADGDGIFTAVVPPKAEGVTATQAAELRRIDNTRYRYFFHTRYAGAVQGDALEVRLVQVTCTRG